MSGWDAYIDSVTASGLADGVALFALDGGGCWNSGAHQHQLKCSEAEARAIAQVMNNDDFTPFQVSGVTIGGVKYQFLRSDADEGLVLAKKKDFGAMTIQKAGKCLMIAHTLEGKNQGDVNKLVDSMIKYLKDQGY